MLGRTLVRTVSAIVAGTIIPARPLIVPATIVMMLCRIVVTNDTVLASTPPITHAYRRPCSSD